MTIVTGGTSVYGAAVGILMLEAQFPRIPGDMGNAFTWPFPVHYRVVKGATPDIVVRKGAPDLLDAFVAAGKELISMGARGITTNCGFLSIYQEDLRRALGVPVAASSLMQVPLVDRLLPPGRRAGILTISKATLTEAHLAAAGVALDTPVEGSDDGQEFTDAILGNRLTLDVSASRKDMLAAAQSLVSNNKDVGAIVLECTNMCPYAADIAQDTGMPVYSIYDFVVWFQSGLEPKSFHP